MKIQKNHTLNLFHSLFAGSVLAGLFLMGMSPVYAQPLGTREWTGAQNNVFNPSGASGTQGTGPTRNWTNVGEGQDGGGINNKALIVGISAGNLLLAEGGASPYSLHILSSAGVFNLAGDDGEPSSRAMTFTDGVVVDAGVTATFGVGIQATATASSTIRLDIGAGSVLNANRGIGVNSANGRLVKTGTGTLAIRNARATGAGAEFHLEEGTTLFDVGTGSPIGTTNTVTVRLGTESTTATLAGRVTLHGTLVTESTTRSIIDPNGVLNISNVNLSSGATIHFDLGSTDLITGNGALTFGAGNLEFSFTGGEVGQTYSIFDFDSVTDFDPSHFLIASTGYEGSIWSLENGVVSVQVIPEPELAIILLAIPLVGLVSKKRRQNRLVNGVK